MASPNAETSQKSREHRSPLVEHASSMERPLDEFHWHEAVHTACIAFEFFAEHVREHPVIDRTPSLTQQADAVMSSLSAFYSEVSEQRARIPGLSDKMASSEGMAGVPPAAAESPEPNFEERLRAMWFNGVLSMEDFLRLHNDALRQHRRAVVEECARAIAKVLPFIPNGESIRCVDAIAAVRGVAGKDAT